MVSSGLTATAIGVVIMTLAELGKRRATYSSVAIQLD